MRSLLGCLILFIFILFPAGVAAEELTITVAAETILPGPQITLGEVATISGTDAARIAALKELNLGKAPFAGKSIVLSMETFGARLLNQSVDLSGINWEVPPYVKITAEHQTLSGAEILTAAQNCLLEQFSGKPADDFTILSVGSPKDLILPPGEVTLKTRSSFGIRQGTNTSVEVDVLVGGEIKTTLKPRFQVTVFEEIVVTAKPISSGSILTLENLKLERRNVAKGTREYITDLNKVLGLSVRRALGAGIVLGVSSLVKPDIIKRSSPVIIIAQRGGITVSAAGIAMQDGYEGQIIRVQNLKTKKIMAAKVIDADTVKVLIHDGK